MRVPDAETNTFRRARGRIRSGAVPVPPRDREAQQSRVVHREQGKVRRARPGPRARVRPAGGTEARAGEPPPRRRPPAGGRIGDADLPGHPLLEGQEPVPHVGRYPLHERLGRQGRGPLPRILPPHLPRRFLGVRGRLDDGGPEPGCGPAGDRGSPRGLEEGQVVGPGGRGRVVEASPGWVRSRSSFHRRHQTQGVQRRPFLSRTPRWSAPASRTDS